MKLTWPSLSVIFLVLLILSACSSSATVKEKQDEPVAYEYALVLHGGAGFMNFEEYARTQENSL